jgi:hypothetical protein
MTRFIAFAVEGIAFARYDLATAEEKPADQETLAEPRGS